LAAASRRVAGRRLVDLVSVALGLPKIARVEVEVDGRSG